MSKIRLISDTINREDIDSLCQWLQQEPVPQLTKGQLTVELERKWAEKIGTRYSVFVNSGSSAILLLLAAYEEFLGYSPKIVVPALSWATDVSSPMLLGYNTLMCDCNLTDLSCDLNQLEQIFKESYPDIFLSVSPLGLVPDIKAILDLCDRYGVVFIEDNCESMGSKTADGLLGSFGDASVFSMYYGHHLSSIEGGFVNTNNKNLFNLLLSMRSHGWNRDWDQQEKRNMNNLWGIDAFSSLYTFFYPGLNVRSTDLQAFIGLRMLDRLDDYSKKRNVNFHLYLNNIKANSIDLMEREEEFVSNFAFPIVSMWRNKIVADLTEAGIETRPLIAGSIGEQPFWIKKYGRPYCPNASIVHEYGFYLPNHQDLGSEEIEEVCNIVNKYA